MEVRLVGKIIETTYHDTVDKITSFKDTLLNNSFYILNDKKPSIVTYYNINREASTLDPGAKIAYDNIGRDTPIRFNRITDFIIYGLNKIELQTENDEFGLEAEKISGECYVLPCTIKPTEGDYFEFKHIKDSSWLFIVTDVQQDTLNNGSNLYKLSYKLEYVDHDRILNNIVEDYKMIEQREGTNITKVVLNKKYEKAKRMDEIAVKLKTYYNELFYNAKVQTFIYMDLTEWRVYDPYMIEFLIRNKTLDNGLDSYIYVGHQLIVPNTFAIEYDDSLYRAFEKRDVERLLGSDYTIALEDIVSYGTTFAGRYEPYFKAVYTKPNLDYRIVALPEELIYQIHDGILVDDLVDPNEPSRLWQNVLTKYFRNMDYTEEELVSVDEMRFTRSYQDFYIIPLLILCLERAIEKVLS